MTVFSIAGKGLKFDTIADVAPYVKDLEALNDVTEVHLSGNTFGVEASKAIAKALRDKKELKVSTPFIVSRVNRN
jgi:Ran GTPase-activating protein 1